MKELSHFRLLIFSTFLSQAIAISLDENIDESSDLHIRRKRVIDLTNEEGRPIFLRGAPYIVNIQQNDTTVCAGSILSAVFVLVSSLCVDPPILARLRSYTILSGTEMRNSGTIHSIVRRIVVSSQPMLALLQVSPHFDFHQSPNRPISLFLGDVPSIAYGIFSGWGCTQPGNSSHEPVYPEKLMQTRLYIIPLEECQRIYQGRFSITNKYMCTLDTTRRRGTCIGDHGGTLAIQVPPLQSPHLIGVMTVLRGDTFGRDPDVFINLNHDDINQWINHVINNHAAG